ncbi:sensor histidine kinase [Massilia glaciei]|uniref:Histidine kinase n=1 Tax=Massilia glaciei TaxID=1524097 RepID=A0A2U2HGS2_9BURK|nr:histidine kinase [Massilia glaciei]PWF44391.1 histidine kinase [Massilia glaciei]
MPSRFKHNQFVLGALLAAVLFATIELFGVWSGGPVRADLNNPLGMLSRAVAAWFTPAPSLLRAGSDRAELAFTLFFYADAALVALFIWLLYRRVDPGARRSPSRNEGLIVAQLLIGLLIDSVLFNMVVAAQLAALMALRRGLAWLAVQVVVGLAADLYLLLGVTERQGMADGMVWTVMFMVSLERVVQALAFGIAHIVGRERRARLSLAAAHAELLATQSLLGDLVRSSERMRIARDLHDVVGHHLTALNLHLDLALRQSDGKVAASLRTSRDLAHDMLAEVRTMVGTERRDQPIHLREALLTMCSGIPAPKIRVTFDDQCEIHSAATAHALFYCVQEAITNAVRHAQAKLLTIDVGCRGDALVVTIADDGRGRAGDKEGNGLRGMRERLAQLGGVLSAGNLPLRGFGLALSVPLAGVAP